MIRVASGSGYWGDWPQALSLQVNAGLIDYLILDYLAEVTMSILNKQKRRDPSMGFATDFVRDVAGLLPRILEKKITVISNAGGVNPKACAQALLAHARQQGMRSLRVAVVSGDNILPQLSQEQASAFPLRPMDGEGFGVGAIPPKLASANVYLGADPIVAALQRHVQIVITGRVTDTALTLAPMMHAFDVQEDDWDAKALGVVAGHILECGAQASGGNFLGDWRAVKHPERIGYPIAEFHGRDKVVITKHETLGGLVNQAVLKEQLLYEIGDPTIYLSPDCTADFTTIQLHDDGANRVLVDSVRGGPPPETLKVTCAYEAGWQISGQITYCWPEAEAKARAAGKLLRQRVEQTLGSRSRHWRMECVGVDACHGALGRTANPQEVTLRVSASSADRRACEQVGREITALILTGPPGATGFSGGRPKPSAVLSYWSALVPSNMIHPAIEVFSL